MNAMEMRWDSCMGFDGQTVPLLPWNVPCDRAPKSFDVEFRFNKVLSTSSWVLILRSSFIPWSRLLLLMTDTFLCGISWGTLKAPFPLASLGLVHQCSQVLTCSRANRVKSSCFWLMTAVCSDVHVFHSSRFEFSTRLKLMRSFLSFTSTLLRVSRLGEYVR